MTIRNSILSGAFPFFWISAAFCDNLQSPIYPGEILTDFSLPASYNKSSTVHLNKGPSSFPLDWTINASFLFLEAEQGGMDLGSSSALVPNLSGTGYVTTNTSNGKVLLQDFNYQPSFQVGIGANFCEWMLAAKYTSIRNTTHASATAPQPDPVTGTGVWIPGNWFQQLSPAGQTISGTHLSSKWKLSLDIADLTAGRPFYQGRQLTLSPFFGLRAAWIRQHINLSLAVPTTIVSSPSHPTITSTNLSRCWGIGPRMGFATQCLLGSGFRIEADAAASLLFTQYAIVSHAEQVANSLVTPSLLAISASNQRYLRPEADLALALGWGSYLSNYRYYFDLSAGYEFVIFWEQNMLRSLLDQNSTGIGASASNLYLNGLTITARFDF